MNVRDIDLRPGNVEVRTSARLHLGFLDPSGSGRLRRFGSLGLALDEFPLIVRAQPAATLSAVGPDAGRALQFARALARLFDQEEPRVALHIEGAMPGHAGLGSGTQLALAVACAAAHALGRPFVPGEVAHFLQRGHRSGIGVGTFVQGGFVLDGGSGDREGPPPIVSRLEFPERWRVIVLLDGSMSGLSGTAERAAFQTAQPFPESACADLCRLVLMTVLPALVEADFAAFSAAIGALQRAVGDHFAPQQGGRFTSPRVAGALACLERRGLAGIGQSSWGPTGFAFVDDDEHAQSLVDELRQEPVAAGLDIRVARARNRGADVRYIECSGSARPLSVRS